MTSAAPSKLQPPEDALGEGGSAQTKARLCSVLVFTFSSFILATAWHRCLSRCLCVSTKNRTLFHKFFLQKYVSTSLQARLRLGWYSILCKFPEDGTSASKGVCFLHLLISKGYIFKRRGRGLAWLFRLSFI